MADLHTQFLGMPLTNPLVASASPLSRSLDTARRLEDAGAAALVMHSLFEEEVREDEEGVARFLAHGALGHAEAAGFLPDHGVYKGKREAYLEHLAALKTALGIPVIASLNGVSLAGWLEHAVELEQAGADAIELNVYYVAADADQPGNVVEARYITLLQHLRAQVTVPINVKLSHQFSSLGQMVRSLEHAGASGVTLFNRFYLPDIDIERLVVAPRLLPSGPQDVLLAMHWIAILHGRVGLSLAGGGGVASHEDVVKLLLAGCDAVCMAQSLLAHGPEYLTNLLLLLERWLDAHEYHSVQQIKGSMSLQHSPDPVQYERLNYVKVLESYRAPTGVRR